MKRFCVVLSLALSLASSGTAIAMPKCAIASADEFLASVEKAVKRVHVVPKPIMDNFLINVNKFRAAKKMFPIEGDMMIIGELNNGKIGTIMFKDGCVVPGTEGVSSLEDARKFMREMNAEDVLADIGVDS